MQGVTLNLGGKPLLDSADLSVEIGDRLCLVGRNGAGKSSLLALLGGQMQPNSGMIIRPGTLIGQMPQDVPEHWNGTVFSLVAEVLGEEGKALAAAHAGADHSVEIAGGWERYGELLGIIRRQMALEGYPGPVRERLGQPARIVHRGIGRGNP